jgi:hypothetical protein
MSVMEIDFPYKFNSFLQEFLLAAYLWSIKVQ